MCADWETMSVPYPRQVFKQSDCAVLRMSLASKYRYGSERRLYPPEMNEGRKVLGSELSGNSRFGI